MDLVVALVGFTILALAGWGVVAPQQMLAAAFGLFPIAAVR